MTYRATHYSSNDQSLAMLVDQNYDYVTMMNVEGDVWVDHENTWVALPELHAHIATYGVDCDGGHGQDYIMFLNDEEIAEHISAQGVNDFHDYSFKSRILSGFVNWHPDHGHCEVKVDTNGFSVHLPTDEGYSSAQVTWCEDDCDDVSSQYDQYAEMMGY